MPNFGADLVAGYYKTPPSVIPSIAALIDATPVRDPAGGGTYALLDPCAGDGEALLLCAHALFGTPLPAAGKGPRLLLYGCELEDTRAGALAQAFRAAGLPAVAAVARHSDAFRLTLALGPQAVGVSLLWANPPYTTTANPVYGRLEQAFLERFTPFITPGSGLLVYIIPGHVLATSATYLATHYADLAVYRFPGGEYEAYKQIVLLARRRPTPLPFGAEAEAQQLTAWAAHPAHLPALPDPGTVPPRFRLLPGARDGLAEFAVSAIDRTRVLAHYTPWALGTLDATAGPPVYPLLVGGRPASRPTWQIAGDPGLGLPLDALLYQAHRTVMPPRAEHRALFAASGMFNNLPLLPDDPAAGLPPALVKGLYEKETVEVKQNHDKDGKLTSVLCVQQPRMRLRLRTLGPASVQVDLPAGSTPTGATDPRQMNIADLFAVYGQGLGTWMRRMFQPTHDPADAARFVPLPPLPRALFQAQAHLVQAGIKQLGGGATSCCRPTWAPARPRRRWPSRPPSARRTTRRPSRTCAPWAPGRAGRGRSRECWSCCRHTWWPRGGTSVAPCCPAPISSSSSASAICTMSPRTRPPASRPSRSLRATAGRPAWARATWAPASTRAPA